MQDVSECLCFWIILHVFLVFTYSFCILSLFCSKLDFLLPSDPCESFVAALQFSVASVSQQKPRNREKEKERSVEEEGRGATEVERILSTANVFASHLSNQKGGERR